ncbi:MULTISPECIES: efflux RND transporter periplasmic adaptor subunit [Methylorubrum]|jgi:cobalt-zinc-cadmium efflux system membrane fusion protein|uniref:Efflux transporter, RND family, MFP subunit n=3 Tax=Methylorubrum extorquens TaxID=408 RepID=B7KR79_METC4|nr:MULTISPECIES: efflux RND transporter periplasmic adaptor subunit [Methylorubrum]KQQ11597.1 hemolysin secretion protein D [Methylobacterium sp. Leaf121]MDF9861430.1 cobalt-zinc-cadmium efflux system membrane fusion protein [Methylorubrum pseudosasae]MDH6635056.1 cobalt-zinc-cadmium efflux system membrane fusion protein [Methylobacterium sp. SuP10 SLI 274]ACK82284.1 efflux transporter, RND family, MFP subunit [Methylorubrum extorquens CM4]APX83523.1 efflux transporter periplasmic adaptor subu
MGGAHDDNLTPHRMRLRTQLLVACVLGAGAAAALWYGRPKEVDAAVPMPAAVTATAPGRFVLTESQLATVTTVAVEQRLFYEDIATEGKISVDEYRATPVFSPYAGRVITIFARSGERVRQGDKLFSLQANEMVQAQNDFLAALNVLNKTRSQLSYATNTEKRLHDLYDSRVTTLKELQTAQNDLTTAQNDAKTAEVGLEAVRNRLRILGLADDDMKALQTKGAINPETTINAPLSGTVIQRKIGPGQYINTGGSDPSYLIGDLGRVWIVAQLRETDAAKVDLGERIRFRVLAYPNQTFESRINYIGASVDPATRRIVVRAEVDNPKGLLKPEMYASVHIINERETVSRAVPRQSVIFEGDKARVWVLGAGNAVESRAVKTGFLDGNDIEVTEGLALGERVISKGALFIDGMTDQPG